eukprot:scaffold20815_cov146-Isochrysis_galbana.AAC.1
MAPRLLRLELIEADSTADKGAKRVRVVSTEERRELNTGTKIPPARQPDARPGSHRALLPSLTTLARAPALGTGVVSGCLRLRALRMRVRCRTVSWSIPLILTRLEAGESGLASR